VLIADDHALVTTMLTDLLTMAGVRVAVAQTAAEVIEKASALCPALLLVDMQLPTLEGVAILRALRRDAQLQRTPIIAMSAIHWLGCEMHYLEAGASAYICKPIGVKQLDNLIQQWLPVTHR
jgi:DNA-binding response OmpR family regulator